MAEFNNNTEKSEAFSVATFSKLKEDTCIRLNPTASESDFKSSAIFKEIKSNLDKDGPAWVSKMKGVFCFKVKHQDGSEGVWVVDAKNGSGSVCFGGEAKGDVRIVMADEDLYDLMLGKLNPQQAFFGGKLKIQGNMGLAMKLREFQSRAEEFRSKL